MTTHPTFIPTPLSLINCVIQITNPVIFIGWYLSHPIKSFLPLDPFSLKFQIYLNGLSPPISFCLQPSLEFHFFAKSFMVFLKDQIFLLNNEANCFFQEYFF